MANNPETKTTSTHETVIVGEQTKKVSDYKGKKALAFCADVMVPIGEIFADKEIAILMREGKRLKAISVAIKNHLEAVMEFLSVYYHKPVNELELECNVFTLPTVILEILNDKPLLDFFSNALRRTTEVSGGNATENTEASGK